MRKLQFQSRTGRAYESAHVEFLGDFQIRSWQWQGGLAEGVWGLEVGVEDFRAVFLPTRGMSIEEVFLGEFRFGWNSPVPGPVHPKLVPIFAPDGLGWLHGFTELLVRCGLTSNGAPQFAADGRLEYPLHGQIGNLPAEAVSISLPEPGVLEIEAEVDEVRFHFQKWRLTTRYRIRAGIPQIEVIDRVTNRAGRRYDFQLLYHFNLGAPLLEPDSQLLVSADSVVPRDALPAADIEQWNVMPEPRPDEGEQVFFMTPRAGGSGRAWGLVVNPGRTAAAGIEYDTEQLPCFTLWKNPADPRDGYVVGLEPGTNFPNPRRVEAEHGRTVWLAPGESCEFHTVLHFAASSTAVDGLCRTLEI